MPIDDTGVIDASYGPAGLILVGVEFGRAEAAHLKESYRGLTLALRVLRKEDFAAYQSLVEPYLSDVADHSVVGDWRKKIAALDKENERRRRKKKPPVTAHVFMRLQLERHDRAVVKLAGYLKNKDLFVVYPKRMTSQEESEINRRNDELYRVYQGLRSEGKKKTPAVKDAAAVCGYGERRVWEIVKMREPEDGRVG